MFAIPLCECLSESFWVTDPRSVPSCHHATLELHTVPPSRKLIECKFLDAFLFCFLWKTILAVATFISGQSTQAVALWHVRQASKQELGKVGVGDAVGGPLGQMGDDSAPLFACVMLQGRGMRSYITT